MQELMTDIQVRGHTRDDVEILSDLKAAPQRRIPWANLVGLSVHEGVVTLSGRARALADRLSVEETAWQRGVCDTSSIASSSWGDLRRQSELGSFKRRDRQFPGVCATRREDRDVFADDR